jgi:hypothetical protein
MDGERLLLLELAAEWLFLSLLSVLKDLARTIADLDEVENIA